MNTDEPEFTDGALVSVPFAGLIEQAFIGCLLLDFAASIGYLDERQISRDLFYDNRAQSAWDAMRRLNGRNEPVNLVTVPQDLQNFGELREGLLAWLSGCSDLVGSMADIASYFDTLADCRRRRALLAASQRAMSAARDLSAPLDLDAFEKELAALQSRAPKAVSIKELVAEVISDIEGQMNPDHSGGLTTGFTDIDSLTGGLFPGEVTLLAARPSVGKTAFALNVVEHVIGQSRPVGVFSLEMSPKSLVRRLLVSSSGVPLGRRHVNLSDGAFTALVAAGQRIAAAPAYIYESSAAGLHDIRGGARRMRSEHAIELVVIDYLQLIGSNRGSRWQNRQEEVSEISRGLKLMAVELQVPVLCLSQLNRETERDARMPRLSDLRESGALEQDADQVAFLHRRDPDDGENGAAANCERVSWLLKKGRFSATGRVELVFHKSTTRFTSAAEGPYRAEPQASLPYKDL